jgi:hypothetical protein
MGADTRQRLAERRQIGRAEGRRAGVGDIARQHRLPLLGPGQPLFRQIEQANACRVHGGMMRRES